MNPESGRIFNYLNNDEYFMTIKNKEIFSEKLVSTYNLDIISILKKMSMWLSVNNGKKYKRYDKFIVNWLNREGKCQY